LESAFVGALWGCGHDAGQLLFGLIFLLLKDRLKIEIFQVWASRVVGLTLVVIGALGLKEAQEIHESSVVAAGDAPAAITSAEVPEVIEGRKNERKFRTFATGLVYGLQPDALIMVLPALALPSRLAGGAYLGMFLLGTIASMSSYTAFIGSCGEALQERLPWITHRLSIGSSVVAILFGIGILLGELFGINLF
jgi:sulfite exporter TauE/SafE